MKWKHKFFLMLFATALPVVAFAQQDQSSFSFTPPDSDVSIYLLKKIFGLVDGVLVTGGDSQILGGIFGVFNTAVLAIAGILLMYILLVGTVKTAAEGEALGKHWSSIWVPLRSVLGVALLLPKASGYCAIQILVMWLVVQGAGAADMIWNAGLDYLNRGGVIIQETGSSGNFLTLMSAVKSGDYSGLSGNLPGSQPSYGDKVDVAAKLLTAEVCMEGLRYGLEQIRNYVVGQGYPDPGPIPDFINNVDIMEAESNGTRKVVFPPANNIGNYAFLVGKCGSLSWNAVDVATLQKNLQNADTNTMNAAKTARGLAVFQMYEELAPTARQIIGNYFSSNYQPLGHLDNGQWVGGIVNGQQQPALLSGSELVNAAASYFALIRPTLTVLQGQLKNVDFIAKAKHEGWIMAGTYFQNVVSVNNQLSSITSDNKSVSLTDPTLPSADALKATLQNMLPNASQTIIDQNAAKIAMLNNYPDYKAYLTSAQQQIAQGTQTQPGIGNFKFDQNLITFPSIPHIPDIDTGSGLFSIITSAIMRVVSELLNTAIDFMNVALQEFSKILVAPFSLLYTIFFKSFGLIFDGPGHPIIKIAALGDVFITVAVTGFFAMLAGGAIAAFATIGLIVAALIMLAPFLILLFFILFYNGIVMAYYVPFIPFLLFLFAGLGWFIAVIESMVAAPLVAIGFAHPEGEAWGKADPAIMLILNIFLRPAMMIIGFIAAIILSYVAVWLLNFGFERASNGVLSNLTAITWIFGPLFLITTYVTVYMLIIQKCFGLIHQLADRVLTWLSGGTQAQFGAGAAEGALEAAKGGVSSGGQQIGDAAQKVRFKKPESGKPTQSSMEGSGGEDASVSDGGGGGGGAAGGATGGPPMHGSGGGGGTGTSELLGGSARKAPGGGGGGGAAGGAPPAAPPPTIGPED